MQMTILGQVQAQHCPSQWLKRSSQCLKAISNRTLSCVQQRTRGFPIQEVSKYPRSLWLGVEFTKNSCVLFCCFILYTSSSPVYAYTLLLLLLLIFIIIFIIMKNSLKDCALQLATFEKIEMVFPSWEMEHSKKLLCVCISTHMDIETHMDTHMYSP